ncbi:DUF7550 family protein [Halosimplex salinum]|uniref:DUF7550 family protein n=1 Tax=Halosimplex salinum TaxID=1710538 RepID=UPI000F4865B3|nr:hypothetical protein [Halosimplex salinum]
MSDDHDDHGHEERPDYDPTRKELPSGEPPLRSTAPQSEYTTRDVGVGFAVMLVGVAIAFALPLALV